MLTDESDAELREQETAKMLWVAVNALRSYEYGNSAPDLAKMTADMLERHISRLGDAKAPGREFGLNDTHQQTDQCGFDRSASLSENRYVCTCGYTETPKEQT